MGRTMRVTFRENMRWNRRRVQRVCRVNLGTRKPVRCIRISIKVRDVLQSCHTYDPDEENISEWCLDSIGSHIPEEIMIRSPPASSFSKTLTCASARSRTSTQLEPCFTRSSCVLPPASGRRTTFAQSLADVLRESIAATSWRMGCEDHLISQL